MHYSPPADIEMQMRTTRVPPALLCVAVLCTAGCEGSNQRQYLVANDDGLGNATLASRTPCSDCIQLRHLVSLGDSEGRGYLEETRPRVARDDSGRFWVYQRGAVRVFESNGGFLRDVGRAGRGPMEFSDPWPLHRDISGNVHVVDPGNSRLTIISPGFDLVQDAALIGVAGFSDAAPVADGYALNLWLPTPAGIGQPIHIVKNGAVVASFGATADEEILDPLGAMRILATGSTEQVIFAKRFEYAIEVWTLDGSRVVGFRGPALNAKPVQPTFFSPDNPLPSEILHMRVDGRLLWVLIRVPREDWLRHVVEHVYPSGHIGYRVRDGSNLTSLYRSRVDVINLETRDLAASQYLDGLFSLFTMDGLLVENSWASDGSPTLQIWQATLANGQSQPRFRQ